MQELVLDSVFVDPEKWISGTITQAPLAPAPRDPLRPVIH